MTLECLEFLEYLWNLMRRAGRGQETMHINRHTHQAAHATADLIFWTQSTHPWSEEFMVLACLSCRASSRELRGAFRWCCPYLLLIQAYHQQLALMLLLSYVLTSRYLHLICGMPMIQSVLVRI